MESGKNNKVIFKIDNNIFNTVEYYLNLPKIKTCVYKPPSIISNKINRRIIVLGDIHGEFYALLYALYKAKVIDTNGNWTGGDTLVVQVGDQIDKGGRGIDIYDDNVLEELQIIEFLHDLHFKATETNGGVYNLIGNHELMNILGDFRYVSQNHLKNGFGGEVIRKQLFEPGGALAQKLACHTNGILKIDNWIFVHAGLLPEHIENFTIQDINDTIREILLGNIHMNSIKQEIRDILTGPSGFLWNRTYSSGNDPERCNKLNEVIKILNIGENGGMVVGHTMKDTITHDCNKKLWMTDVGLSEAFGRKKNINDRIEVLEIINNGKIVRKI